MLRRSFLQLCAASAVAAAPARRTPNILFLMADDLGVGDVGCYGQKRIRTPHIDRLAAEGLRFTRAYAGCTVCAPSRSVLFSGLHGGHAPIRSNGGATPLRPEETTVAEILHRAGYRTGGFGKWGLGDIGTSGTPTRKGFDEFYGYLHQAKAHYYYPDSLVDNDRETPLPKGTYSHDAIVDRALAFLRKAGAGPAPFFCYVPFTTPHLELLVPEDSLAEYRGKVEERAYVDPRRHYHDQPESRAAYAGMVTRMDRDIGRLVGVLGEMGLERDTVVIFTSDNGAATRIWGDEYFDSTGGLRGGKTNLYEGGIRTPLIVRWPGHVRAGAVSDRLTTFADFLPTACELAGVKAPAKIDGLSLVPVWAGRRQREHSYLYWEQPKQAPGSGVRGWAPGPPAQALRAERWKVIRPAAGAPLELYDLETDPAESRDLAAARPEVLRRMEKLLAGARTPPREQ